MAKKEIRQYSLDDLKAMHERGDYVPTRPDAPTAKIDEEFWQNAHVVNSSRQRVGTFARQFQWFKAQAMTWRRRNATKM